MLIKLISRTSPLAWRQTELIAQALSQLQPNCQIELSGIVTKGDRWLAEPLQKLGGKGLFTEELEAKILAGEVDAAVHSAKDLPLSMHPDLIIAAVPARAAITDVLILSENLIKAPAMLTTWAKCKAYAPPLRIGTTSLRRRSQWLHHRSQDQVLELRGNINTRLQRLAEGANNLDAIILAKAGLERLNLLGQLPGVVELPIADFMPAIAQGALAVQMARHNPNLALVQSLNHWPSYFSIMTERALNRRLGGSCHSPIGAYTEMLTLEQGRQQVKFRGLVASLDGKTCLQACSSKLAINFAKNNITNTYWQELEQIAEQLSMKVAEQLLAQGAKALLTHAT